MHVILQIEMYRNRDKGTIKSGGSPEWLHIGGMGDFFRYFAWSYKSELRLDCMRVYVCVCFSAKNEKMNKTKSTYQLVERKQGIYFDDFLTHVFHIQRCTQWFFISLYSISIFKQIFK